MEYTYKKFRDWKSHIFLLKRPNPNSCVLALFTVFTFLLHTFCDPVVISSINSPCLFILYLKKKHTRIFYIFSTCFSLKYFHIFGSDLLYWLLACFVNIFGYMWSKAAHWVDWNIWLSLHAGHFTPAFILHIPVSFFSPEQQQVLEQSPIHKGKTPPLSLC